MPHRTAGGRHPGGDADLSGGREMAAKEFAYDAFVSYRHQEPDGPWVRGVLVERLRAAGLRVCLDVDDFRLGLPLVLEMARGVERSRSTLAVLSPAYLAWCHAELGLFAEGRALGEEGLPRSEAVDHPPT